MEDSVFRDAAGVSAVRHPNGTLRLWPERRIFMEEEVFTPPRGGGRQVPEPQGVQSEARAVPKTVPEDTVRNSGKGQRNFRSPVEMLVNTVSHMQRDLAIIRDENRTLRTPATSQVIQAPRRRHSRQRKCRGLTERLVGNNITKCLRQLCGRMAGTMIQQHCNCFRIWKEIR